MDQEQQNQIFQPTYGSISFMTEKIRRIPPRVKILELIDTKFVPQTNNNPIQILLQCKVTDGDQNQAEFHFISDEEWDKEKVQQYQPIVQIDDFRKYDEYILVGRYSVLNNENDIIKKEIEIRTTCEEMLPIQVLLNKFQDNGEDENVQIQGFVMNIIPQKDKNEQEQYEIEVQDGTAQIRIKILYSSRTQREKLQINREYKFKDLILQKQRRNARIDNNTLITEVSQSKLKFEKGNSIEQSQNQNCINIIGWVCDCSKIGKHNFKNVRLLTIINENKQQIQIMISDPKQVQDINLPKRQLVALLGLKKQTNLDISLTGEILLEFSSESRLWPENQIYYKNWIPSKPQFSTIDWELKYWQKNKSTVEQIYQELSQYDRRRKLFHIELTFLRSVTSIPNITREKFLIYFQEFENQYFSTFDESVSTKILGMPFQDFLNLEPFKKEEMLKEFRGKKKFDVIFVGWYAEWNNQTRLMFDILDIKVLNQDDQDVQDQIKKKPRTGN